MPWCNEPGESGLFACNKFGNRPAEVGLYLNSSLCPARFMRTQRITIRFALSCILSFIVFPIDFDIDQPGLALCTPTLIGIPRTFAGIQLFVVRFTGVVGKAHSAYYPSRSSSNTGKNPRRASPQATKEFEASTAWGYQQTSSSFQYCHSAICTRAHKFNGLSGQTWNHPCRC